MLAKFSIQILMPYLGLTEPVAIVGSAPHRAELAFEQYLVAFHTQLMCAVYLCHVVLVQEPIDHVDAKHVPCSSSAHSEPRVIRVRIRPHQIGEGPFMGDFNEPFDLFDVADVLDGGGEARMHTEDGVCDYAGDGQVVEQVGEQLPHRGTAVLPLAFRVETVHLGYLPGFVVAAQKGHALWVPDLQQDQVRDGLHTEGASVHVVAQEQVVSVWHVAAHTEDLYQVVELAVNIAYYCHWRLHLLHVLLLGKDLSALGADYLYRGFVQGLSFRSQFQVLVQVESVLAPSLKLAIHF